MDDHIVRVKAGSTLTFELPTGWHLTDGTIGRVTWTEAVRWRSAVPDTYTVTGSIAPTTGPTLRVAAPPVGDWVVLSVLVGRARTRHGLGPRLLPGRRQRLTSGPAQQPPGRSPVSAPSTIAGRPLTMTWSMPIG